MADYCAELIEASPLQNFCDQGSRTAVPVLECALAIVAWFV